MPIKVNPRSVLLASGASKTGNKVVTVDMRLKPGEILTVSASPDLDRIESVYFDATQSSTSFQIDFGDTGRSIVIPPGSESCHRTFSRDTDFVLTNLDPANPVVARMLLFACNMPVYERFPGSGILTKGGVRQPIGVLTQKTDYLNPGPYMVPLGSAWNADFSQFPGDPRYSVAYTNKNQQAQTNGVYDSNNLFLTILSRGSVSSGKWYWETHAPSPGIGYYGGAGVSNSINPDANGSVFIAQGRILTVNRSFRSTFKSITTTQLSFALDADKSLFWFKDTVSNIWNDANDGDNTKNPATGIGGIDISQISKPFAASVTGNNDFKVILCAGTGTEAFTGVIPAGYNPGLPLDPYGT